MPTTSQMIEAARDVAHALLSNPHRRDSDWQRGGLGLLPLLSGASAEQVSEVEGYLAGVFRSAGVETRPLLDWYAEGYWPWHDEESALRALDGATFESVEGMESGSEEVTLRSRWWSLEFYHRQDCCEHVRVEDVCGDAGDLTGVPLTCRVEVVKDKDDDDGSATSTWYHFRSLKGDVTVRWLGESNGYYSEEVGIMIRSHREAE